MAYRFFVYAVDSRPFPNESLLFRKLSQHPLEAQKVADKVKHRKLINPGLLPSFRAEIEDSSPWKQVLIGPESASGIPGFLKANWK